MSASICRKNGSVLISVVIPFTKFFQYIILFTFARCQCSVAPLDFCGAKIRFKRYASTAVLLKTSSKHFVRKRTAISRHLRPQSNPRVHKYTLGLLCGRIQASLRSVAQSCDPFYEAAPRQTKCFLLLAFAGRTLLASRGRVTNRL